MRAARGSVVVLCIALASGCGAERGSETAGDSPPAEGVVEGRAQDAVGIAAERPDFARFFGEIEGAFVLLDPRSEETVRYNPERAATRFLPASTYKIPNSLIALETGVVDGPEFALAWDSVRDPRQDFWPRSWARDHVFRTALPNSVVWFYQELARRIGEARMQAHVDRFDYGNRDISGGIDQFWLSGGLRISPDEQVAFLRRFYEGELGVSERSTDLVKALLLLEETAAYRLSGKTGWGGLGGEADTQVGWLVGFLERGADVWFFATNIQIRTGDEARERLPITKAILGEMDLLDGGP